MVRFCVPYGTALQAIYVPFDFEHFRCCALLTYQFGGFPIELKEGRIGQLAFGTSAVYLFSFDISVLRVVARLWCTVWVLPLERHFLWYSAAS